MLCGDCRRPPWEKAQEDVGRLFAKCKRKELPIFAAGNGVSVIAYYCATGFAPLHVINGRERGGSLNSIHSLGAEDTRKLRDNDVFLDHATGDYYTYEPVYSLNP